MVNWKIRHKAQTASTNRDAFNGEPWNVYTCDWQTNGRGRLNHVWQSGKGTNLAMSAVLPIGALSIERVSTLPVFIGYAVSLAVEGIAARKVWIKWPNDILVDSKKLCGILCERHGDNVIAGIGMNIRRMEFSADIAAKAICLEDIAGKGICIESVRDGILDIIATNWKSWRDEGLAPFIDGIRERDYLNGHHIEVESVDGDKFPIAGYCQGISLNGTIKVAGREVYSGQAHIAAIR